MVSMMMKLGNGPSREQLFDCLRLGSDNPSLRTVEFWAERTVPGHRTGARLFVRVDGLHRCDEAGHIWYFWGKEMADDSAQMFVFGRWNTHLRQGQVVLSGVPMFQDHLATFAFLQASDRSAWSNFDSQTESSIFNICRRNWDWHLAYAIIGHPEFGDQTVPDDANFDYFVRSLAKDADRKRFIERYVAALKARVAGKANCGCVYHAEEGAACPHDLALLK